MKVRTLAVLTALCSGATAFAAAGKADFPEVALPKIPDKTFTITDYGAKGDGATLATEALTKAIAAAKAAGGGKVVVPAGRYLTSPFALASDVELHVDKGATLLLVNDIASYPKNQKTYTDWITAKDCHDVAITGEGTIDGQGQPWWDKYRKRDGVSPKGLLHRPQMFRLSQVTRLLVKDVHLVNSPNFHLIPEDCTDVTIDHITIRSPHDAPNTDGIDPSGWNFHIVGCTIDTGDDNIAIKAHERGKAAQDRPSCENFLVEDCTFLHGHGMSIGGQTPGGLRHLLVRNCSWAGTEAGIRMKAPRGQGGVVEDCVYEDSTMKGVKVPIYITSYYPSIPPDVENDAARPVTKTTPVWRDIHITNLTATDCPEAGRIIGLPEMPVSDVTFTNVHIAAGKGMRIVRGKDIKFVDSSIKVKEGPALIVHDSTVTGLGEGAGGK